MNGPGLISDWVGFLTNPNPLKTIADHAEEVAESYKNFAQTVTSSSPGVFIGPDGKAAMKAALMALQTNVLGPAAALIYEAACIAFWGLSINNGFATAPPAPGLTVEFSNTHTVPTGGSIAGPLTAAFASPISNASLKGAMIANAFIAGTSTITTSHTGLFIIIPSTVGPFPVQ